jgi:sulfur carrier protein
VVPNCLLLLYAIVRPNITIARPADAVDVRDDSGHAQRMCQTTTPTAYVASVLRLGNCSRDRPVRRHIIAVATLAVGHTAFGPRRDNNQGKAPAARFTMGGAAVSDNLGSDGPSRASDDGSVVITVNGRRIYLRGAITVARLLQSLGYPDRGVAVALNRAVLRRSYWQKTLSDGARLEVLTAVQGGRPQADDRGQHVHVAAQSCEPAGPPTSRCWRDALVALGR